MGISRRRSVNSDQKTFDRAKEEYGARGSSSATAVFTDILLGKSPPMFAHVPGGGKKGVSMSEAVFFSLKERAKKIDKPISTTMALIISGGERPLTQSEISYGSAVAFMRESQRFKEIQRKQKEREGEEKEKELLKKEEERRKAQKLSTGEPMGDTNSTHECNKSIDPSMKHFGGVFEI